MDGVHIVAFAEEEDPGKHLHFTCHMKFNLMRQSNH